MQPVFEEAQRLLVRGEPFVLASVVRTQGSTPQKPGAKLLVRKDGTAVGTLGGGCIEADVWAEAKSILDKKGSTQLRTFELNEEIAARDGLVCGGTMHILIDPVAEAPVSERASLEALLPEVLAAFRGEGDCALATLSAGPRDGAKGSPAGARPAPESGSTSGAKLFIRADGSVLGSLGSEALDRQAKEAAMELMPRGRNRWLEAGSDHIFVESFTTPPTLVIAGGGHVGKALYTLAKFVGFRVFIVDDRPLFANKERFPDADGIIVDDFDAGLRSLDMGLNHYVIVATRGHKLDDIALMEAARSKAGYVGLLGSKRKAMLIYQDLFRNGIPQERIEQVHSPVGLNLGGRSPEEIAFSIVAEMLAIKNDGDGSTMKMGTAMVSKAKELAARPQRRPRLT